MKKRRVVTYVDDQVYGWLKVKALDDRRSVSDYVSNIVDRHLQQLGDLPASPPPAVERVDDPEYAEWQRRNPGRQ